MGFGLILLPVLILLLLTVLPALRLLFSKKEVQTLDIPNLVALFVHAIFLTWWWVTK
jgi:hypothetical protein